MNDIPSGLRSTRQEVVEIRFWEVYLLRSRHNLNNILSTYSVDKGPLRKESKYPERVVFRFMRFDWDRTIKLLLSDISVPFEVVNVSKIDITRHMMKKKVYLAEDDLNILFALDTMLEGAGYDVMLSHCGSPMMEKNLPVTDLFILDNRMPDVNGIDVCRHLKNQVATKHIPIVMISAFRNFRHQALKAGVDDYLEKPFSMEELLRLVAKHTGQRGQSSDDVVLPHLGRA